MSWGAPSCNSNLIWREKSVATWSLWKIWMANRWLNHIEPPKKVTEPRTMLAEDGRRGSTWRNHRNLTATLMMLAGGILPGRTLQWGYMWHFLFHASSPEGRVQWEASNPPKLILTYCNGFSWVIVRKNHYRVEWFCNLQYRKIQKEAGNVSKWPVGPFEDMDNPSCFAICLH